MLNKIRTTFNIFFTECLFFTLELYTFAYALSRKFIDHFFNLIDICLTSDGNYCIMKSIKPIRRLIYDSGTRME